MIEQTQLETVIVINDALKYVRKEFNHAINYLSESVCIRDDESHLTYVGRIWFNSPAQIKLHLERMRSLALLTRTITHLDEKTVKAEQSEGRKGLREVKDYLETNKPRLREALAYTPCRFDVVEYLLENIK